MPQSRRSRRRSERARAKHVARSPASRDFSPIVRAVLFIGALALILGAIVLLTGASSTQQARLGRIAGIGIVIALVMGYAAVRGRL